MTSPSVEINSTSLGGWTPMAGGVNVVAGELVSVRLADSSGVKLWFLDEYGIDELETFPTITQASSPSASATFTAPATVSALVIRSRVGVNVLGKDLFDQAQPTYTTTFGVYVPTTINAWRLGAENETTEGNETAGWVSKINQLIRDDGGSSVTTAERTPFSLALQQVSKQDLLTAAGVGVQPSNLLLFADDMSVTTLTRFTQLSDGTPVTPTIASNLMTFNTPGGGAAKINVEQEGSDITMPQFMSTLRVSSVTHTGADTNAGENISVGICKDTNNFIMALWQRKQGTFGTVSVQVKIGGVQNLRGAVTLGAALTTPFDIGLSCVANSLTFWQRPNGGAWTKLTSWALTEIDLKTASLTGWKPAFRITSSGTDQATFNVTNFKFGSFGAVSFRDPVLFSNEDGSPYIASGDLATLTATLTDSQGANYCGVLTLDLVTHALTQIGVIMVSRGGAIQNDTAAHVVYYNDASSRLWITSWGNFGTGAANIQIYYKSIGQPGQPDLALPGANIIDSMTQLTLPGLGLGGAYDPYAVKTGGTWYLAYTVGPVAANSYYPALSSTTDLSTYTAIGSDTLNVLFEGTRIVQLSGTYYVLAAGALQTNVYDLGMNYVGIMPSPLINTGTANAHPTLVVHGNYIYMVTFDSTTVNGAGNWGQFREFRSPRYEIVLP